MPFPAGASNVSENTAERARLTIQTQSWEHTTAATDGATPGKAEEIESQASLMQNWAFSHSMPGREKGGKQVFVGHLLTGSSSLTIIHLTPQIGTIMLIFQVTSREDKWLGLKNQLSSQHAFSLQKNAQVRLKANEHELGVASLSTESLASQPSYDVGKQRETSLSFSPRNLYEIPLPHSYSILVPPDSFLGRFYL